MRTYLVGGAVRDLYLGLKPKDIDYAIEAKSYDEMRTHILSVSKQIYLEKPEFGTIRALMPEGAVDFVLCRKDGYYADHRRPDSISVGTIYDDLARRDFTVNAMAIEVNTNEALDPYGGVSDLAAKILRCVGSAEDRLIEDPLRGLRAIRFAVTKGFKIDSDIRQVMRFNKDFENAFTTLPHDRIREELTKCFKHNSEDTIFALISFLNQNSLQHIWKEIWLKPTMELR